MLEKGVIQLPPSKHPEDIGKANDHEYFLYHRVIGDSLSKCITLKERFMQLNKNGTLILDLDEAVKTNHMTVWYERCASPQQQ